MTTVSIRLTKNEMHKIRRAKEEASKPWPVSRHRLMKEAIFRGLEAMETERELSRNTGV